MTGGTGGQTLSGEAGIKKLKPPQLLLGGWSHRVGAVGLALRRGRCFALERPSRDCQQRHRQQYQNRDEKRSNSSHTISERFHEPQHAPELRTESTPNRSPSCRSQRPLHEQATVSFNWLALMSPATPPLFSANIPPLPRSGIRDVYLHLLARPWIRVDGQKDSLKNLLSGCFVKDAI